MSLPVVTVSQERLVCPHCPWRERREITPEMGLACHLHIARYDAAPFVVLVETWLRRRGFRVEGLRRIPTHTVIGFLRRFVAKFRGEGVPQGLEGPAP